MPLEVLLSREVNANFTPKLGLLLRPAGLAHEILPPQVRLQSWLSIQLSSVATLSNFSKVQSGKLRRDRAEDMPVRSYLTDR
jgi:hypothetical protein